jgi:hypothetical protein
MFRILRNNSLFQITGQLSRNEYHRGSYFCNAEARMIPDDRGIHIISVDFP